MVSIWFYFSGVLDWQCGSAEAWAQRHQPESRPDATFDLRPEGGGGACAKDRIHTRHKYPAGSALRATSDRDRAPAGHDCTLSCCLYAWEPCSYTWGLEKRLGCGSTYVRGHVTPSGHVERAQSSWCDLQWGCGILQPSSWDHGDCSVNLEFVICANSSSWRRQ